MSDGCPFLISWLEILRSRCAQATGNLNVTVVVELLFVYLLFIIHPLKVEIPLLLIVNKYGYRMALKPQSQLPVASRSRFRLMSLALGFSENLGPQNKPDLMVKVKRVSTIALTNVISADCFVEGRVYYAIKCKYYHFHGQDTKNALEGK